MAGAQMENWHEKTATEVALALGTDPEKGLSSQEAGRRLLSHGPNRMAEKKGKGLLRRFIDQFADALIYILLAAALVSVLLGEISDSIIILAVVLINAVVGLVQESKAEKAIAALKKLSSPRAPVMRDGIQREIDTEAIVPGDLVVVDAGRILPCDLRWSLAVNLRVDEASLTGESVPVEKDASLVADEAAPLGDRLNMGYMSTIASYGRGHGMAVATGMGTELGRIAAMLEAETQEPTPLQKKLETLGKRLGAIILALCALLFVLGLGEELLRSGAMARGSLFELFLTSVSLAVAAIPEGLPAIVTIVLAIGVQLMSREQAIVRRLPAVESLGSVTMICSDKTGTLTRNRMAVVAFSADGSSGPASGIDPPHPGMRLFLEVLALCNDASLGSVGDSCEEPQATGDPTEIALLELANANGVCVDDLIDVAPRVGELPFDSARKMMSTLNARGSERLVMTKGAVDILLGRCDRIMVGGRELALDREGRSPSSPRPTRWLTAPSASLAPRTDASGPTRRRGARALSRAWSSLAWSA